MSGAHDLLAVKGVVVADRYHDISCGHRVHGHESKCRHLHGHNYRIHFYVVQDDASKTDSIGRVMDFSAIKSKLCMWLEDNWDHKFLAWEQDTLMQELARASDTYACPSEHNSMLHDSIVWTPFNPTAENMAAYLVNVIGPRQLKGSGCRLVACTIDETAKCHASYIGGEV